MRATESSASHPCRRSRFFPRSPLVVVVPPSCRIPTLSITFTDDLPQPYVSGVASLARSIHPRWTQLFLTVHNSSFSFDPRPESSPRNDPERRSTLPDARARAHVHSVALNERKHQSWTNMFSTKMSLGAVAALALASGANALALDLTVDTFDGQVLNSGKSAFIKFYAPWCV